MIYETRTSSNGSHKVILNVTNKTRFDNPNNRISGNVPKIHDKYQKTFYFWINGGLYIYISITITCNKNRLHVFL